MAMQAAAAFGILELSADATDEDRKAAYKRLAKEHHPDRPQNHGDADATVRFQRLQQANEVLHKFFAAKTADAERVTQNDGPQAPMASMPEPQWWMEQKLRQKASFEERAPGMAHLVVPRLSARLEWLQH